MPFNTPAFSVLSVSTKNLEVKLSDALKRYNRGDLSALIQRFDRILARSKSKRDTQMKALASIREEVGSITKGQKEYESGLEYFLGALFHRYFRIRAEYDNAFFSKDPMACDLFIDLRLTLDLNEETKDYAIADGIILDELTVYTCLSAFQNNMLSKIAVDPEKSAKKTEPKYKRINHFAKDSNFESHLEEMIKEHRAKAGPLLKQFKAVRFLQNLVGLLELENRNTEVALDSWGKALQQGKIDLKDITRLEEHLVKMDSIKNTTKEIIITCLQTNRVKEKINGLDYKTFIELLKVVNLDLATHTLSGGYILILHKIRTTKYDKLKTVLLDALNINLEKAPNALDNQTIVERIRMLKEFLEGVPEAAELDCSFFTNRSGLNGDIINLGAELSTQKETPAAAAAPSI